MKSCNCTTHESRSFTRRKGRVEVTLSTVCADDDRTVKTFCLDVSEYANGKSTDCVENEHGASSLPLDASATQIKRYLTAALAAAHSVYTAGRSLSLVAEAADLSGRCAIEAEAYPL